MMQNDEHTQAKTPLSSADIRPWVFRIWLVIAMTFGAVIGHSFAFGTFGHPKGQPRSVMYWFAGLIALGSLIGAVVAYATRSGLSVERRR
jgi:hypothetical protein